MSVTRYSFINGEGNKVFYGCIEKGRIEMFPGYYYEEFFADSAELLRCSAENMPEGLPRPNFTPNIDWSLAISLLSATSKLPGKHIVAMSTGRVF